MNVFVIKTADDHRRALARMNDLMDAEAGTPAAAELEVLGVLVERYETDAFPLEAPTIRDAIEFAMEQRHYRQADLAKVLGSRSRASEILNGKRTELSLEMARRLHEQWRIPAEVLIQRPPEELAPA